MCVSLVTAVY